MNFQGKIKSFHTYEQDYASPVGLNIKDVIHKKDLFKLQQLSSLLKNSIEIELKYRIIKPSIKYFIATFRLNNTDIIGSAMEVTQQKWNGFHDIKTEKINLLDYSKCSRYWVCSKDLLDYKPDSCYQCCTYELPRIRVNESPYNYGTHYRSKDV